MGVDTRTTYEQFTLAVQSDARASNLDPGNIKMAFNSMLEKAEAREKERAKKEERDVRRKENTFKTMLKQASPALEAGDEWEDVRERFEEQDSFIEVRLESERIRIFNEWMDTHCTKKKNRRKKKKKKFARKRNIVTNHHLKQSPLKKNL